MSLITKAGWNFKVKFKFSAVAEAAGMIQTIRNRRLRSTSEHVSGPSQIDLNVTVPYIFSARLYPFGEVNGDDELPLLEPNAEKQLRLKFPLKFLEKTYHTIYVSLSLTHALHLVKVAK